MSRYRWVHHGAGKLFNVGILPDGSVYNPNNYPEETVRAAVLAADARRHERRSNAAKKAARTRQERQAKEVYVTAQRIVSGAQAGPRKRCCICGRGLDDPQSVERGIGSECWQGVLSAVERIKTHKEAEAVS